MALPELYLSTWTDNDTDAGQNYLCLFILSDRMSSENTTPSHISASVGAGGASSSWTEMGTPSFTDSSRSVVTNFGQSPSPSDSEVVNHVTSIFVPGSDCVEFHTSASGGDVCCVLLFCFIYLRVGPYV